MAGNLMKAMELKLNKTYIAPPTTPDEEEEEEEEEEE